jgi:alpha-L-fucosidase
VVEAFVKACERRGLMPCFYYCSWDNHHRLGSLTPSDTRWEYAFTTEAYREFQWKQIEELLTQYGRIGEVWVDIPKVLPRDYRHRLYNRIAELQPEAIIMMNNGFGDGSTISVSDTWPSDIVAIERFLPNSHTGHQPWKEIEGRRYYIPGEVCDPIGREWFYVEGDQPRSDAELLGMYLVTRGRGANLLLDVGPDKHGLIPEHYAAVLARLRANLDRLGV